MIRTFLFDMGGVLIRFSHEKLREQVAAVLGTDPATIEERVYQSGLLWKFERGQLSSDEMHQTLCEMFGVEVDRETLYTAASDIFWPMEQMTEYLTELKASGYRLVLFSNTSIWHVGWIRERYDFLDLFDALTLSYEAGAIKPEDPIYHDALGKIDCQPNECIYVDDLPENIERGRHHGLHGIIFRDPSRLRDEVDSLL